MLKADPVQSYHSDDVSHHAEQRELKVILASPRGFCAGVRRAIGAVEDALRLHGAPVFVRRPIVHNRAVMADLERQGAIFVEELDEVPQGAVVILSAHGVAPDILAEARNRGLRAFDAVCPLVAKIHREVERSHREGRHVILIGHAEHPEIIATLGHIPRSAVSLISQVSDVEALTLHDGQKVAVAVQTTFSVEDCAEIIAVLRERFRNLREPAASDICYATSNRQAAVRILASRADTVIVVGEQFSSNACRLAELARASGCGSVQLIADGSSLDWNRISPEATIGLTAAASTPDTSVSGILDLLRQRYRLTIEELVAVEESVQFKPLQLA